MTFEQFAQEWGLPIAMLLVALITGARGDWVFGREHKASIADRDEWRDIALTALNIAEKQ